MPDGVVSGYRGGLDMAQLWGEGGEGGGSSRGPSGVTIARLDSPFTSRPPPSVLPEKATRVASPLVS